MHHEDFTLVAHRIAQRFAIGNCPVVDENHHMLTETLLIVQDVSSQTRILREDRVERLPHIRSDDLPRGTVEMLL